MKNARSKLPTMSPLPTRPADPAAPPAASEVPAQYFGPHRSRSSLGQHCPSSSSSSSSGSSRGSATSKRHRDTSGSSNYKDSYRKKPRVSQERYPVKDNNSYRKMDDQGWSEADLPIAVDPEDPPQKVWVNSNRKNWGSDQQSGRFSNNRGQRNGWGRGRVANNRFSDRRDNNYSNTQQSNEFNGESTVIYVDSSKVGRVIGKGGSKIRELESESGARIKINKNCVQGNSTGIDISGSTEAQEKAKELINELTSNTNQRDRYDNQRDRNYNRFDNDSAQSFFSEENRVENQAKTETEEERVNFDWSKAARDYEEHQRQKWASYPPIIKNFYKEDPAVANLTPEQVAQIRLANHDTKVKHTFEADDFKIPNPVVNFVQAFSNYPDILTEISKQGFDKPSPIQSQGWPILLKGKDMIGIAQTGTGKTLTFLLPALIHIDNQTTPRSERIGPTVLVMAPTRELALQIEKEVNKYSYHGIKAVCVYGGGDRKNQKDAIHNKAEIVIATPGRLNDLVQSGDLEVTCVTYLVLDEADRMLDMGFEPQIRKTLLDVRPDRQTIMTSATWPPGVRRLAESYMKNPLTVCVGSLDLKAVHSVTQTVRVIDEEEKEEELMQFFQKMGPEDKAIVFFGKKTKVDDIGSDLAIKGVQCQSIHGGREQCDREQALADIKDGTVRILLATDVASRGIDIEDITHVLNFDFPRDIEEYVHRVGRTGRANRTGESISFITRKDWALMPELIKILEEATQEVPEEIYTMADRYSAWRSKKDEEDRLYGRRGGGSRGGGRGGGGRNRYRN